MKSYTESNEYGTSAWCQKSKGPLDGLCVHGNERKSVQIGREMSKRYSKKGGEGEEREGEGGR